MTEYKSDFLQTMARRGYLHQCTDGEALDTLAQQPRGITCYVGYDCTGPSLHVGHLLSIMMLRRLQQAGHKPIVLMGGGTTKVGDPSGKDEQRKLLTEADIAANMASIKTVFNRFVKFGDGPTDAIMVNNADWLDKLQYIEFLRDYGRHFSVNRMLSFDSVKVRLDREQPLSFLEFNYMILQAYDFVELARRYGCNLQMGGSDQWGNIVNGVELGRRAHDLSLYGLTCPLLMTASGQKMGKTASGAVWLNDDMLPTWDYWQYWRNCEDADVGRFLRLFTDLPMDEITRLEKLEGAELNEAKKILATEATALCRGREAAEAAAETARKAFEEGSFGGELPVVKIDRARLDAGIEAFALVLEAGLAKSGGEARRHIRGNAIKLNDRPVKEETQKIGSADLGTDGRLRLSFGKKQHVLIEAA
ncbi:MAG TPA: tyrosine--tRNA ligase [Ferrovibrio sp.]|uniref:tyrosine--tRNA ligase n=1 Tax=Ferrovibrio sp. TaxID=1917215 RepID=UPI002B4B1DE9|nr:tyrosine--tRNA ligase [Ferrovibrio sp.]HLT77409.1 tyrosine--tRNA ligase [Ferrovibrio sp.]